MKAVLSENLNSVVFGLMNVDESNASADEAIEGYSIDPWGQFQAAADSLRGYAIVRVTHPYFQLLTTDIECAVMLRFIWLLLRTYAIVLSFVRRNYRWFTWSPMKAMASSSTVERFLK